MAGRNGHVRKAPPRGRSGPEGPPIAIAPGVNPVPLPPGPVTPPPAGQAPTVGAFTELGLTGLRRHSGYVHEEFLKELQGKRGMQIYREMSDNDPTVGAFLYAQNMLTRQATFPVKPGGDQPEDQARADFVSGCLHDMSSSWQETLAEILSMLPFGWAWHEIVYKRRTGEPPGGPAPSSQYRDGKIGWRKWGIRAQETLFRWDFDPAGGVRTMIQQPPPDYRIIPIPIEKALLFRPSTARGNPEGKSILRSAYRCFAEDTELLTRRGWLRVGGVTITDEVATLNAAGEIEYQCPTAVWAYPYDGEMVRAHSRFVDQLVTPNHRMWVRREHKTAFEFVEAGECNARVSFAADGSWPAKDLEVVMVGEHAVPGDTWCAFLGLWLAEGHSWKGGSRHVVGITQKAGPKADAIRALLHRLPWSVYERRDRRGMIQWVFTRKELWATLAPLGKSRTKRMPRAILDASARQLGILLDWYALGDGTPIGRLSYKGRPRYAGTHLLFTASEGLADDLMEAIVKAGRRPSKRLLGGRRLGGPVWAVTVGKAFDWLRARWSMEPYRGAVYCVTTPNGVVYCRRNGKVSWSGNSWYYKRRIEEIEAIGAERDLAGMPVLVPPATMDLWSDTPQARAAKSEAEFLVRSIRRDEQEGVLLPSGWDLKLLSTGSRRQFDTSGIITRYDVRILLTVMHDWLLLGHETSGSWALSRDKTRVSALAQSAQLDGITGVINRHAIPRLLQLNAESLERRPTVTHEEVDPPDLTELGGYVLALAQAGMPVFPEGGLQNALLRAASLPVPPETDGEVSLEKRLKKSPRQWTHVLETVASMEDYLRTRIPRKRAAEIVKAGWHGRGARGGQPRRDRRR